MFERNEGCDNFFDRPDSCLSSINYAWLELYASHFCSSPKHKIFRKRSLMTTYLIYPLTVYQSILPVTWTMNRTDWLILAVHVRYSSEKCRPPPSSNQNRVVRVICNGERLCPWLTTPLTIENRSCGSFGSSTAKMSAKSCRTQWQLKSSWLDIHRQTLSDVQAI